MEIPFVIAVIPLVAHIFVLIVLMLFFRLNIYAVVIANTFFAFLMCVLNARAIQKYSGYRQEYVKTFVIPALCSAIMGLVAYFVYKGMYTLVKNNTLSFLAAFVLAVLVYAVTLLVFKGLTEEEILKFPKGALLVKLAKKLHLLQ